MNKFDTRISNIDKLGEGSEFIRPLVEVGDTLETITLLFDDLGIEKRPEALAKLVEMVFERKSKLEWEAKLKADAEAEYSEFTESTDAGIALQKVIDDFKDMKRRESEMDDRIKTIEKRHDDKPYYPGKDL